MLIKCNCLVVYIKTIIFQHWRETVSKESDEDFVSHVIKVCILSYTRVIKQNCYSSYTVLKKLKYISAWSSTYLFIFLYCTERIHFCLTSFFMTGWQITVMKFLLRPRVSFGGEICHAFLVYRTNDLIKQLHTCTFLVDNAPKFMSVTWSLKNN